MNLHGIVSGAIGVVNPQFPVSVQLSTGSTLVPGGKRVPSYSAPLACLGQVQPVSYKDITQLDGLNIQGTRRAIYLFDRVDGLIRSQLKGGDLITIAFGPWAGIYLVALVAEQWPDWCKALVTLQND